MTVASLHVADVLGVVDHSVTDYRRGRRYKKLARMLGSQIVQQYAKRFKLHSLLVVAAIMCIHVAIFAVMYYHLEKEKVGEYHQSM